MKRPVCSCLSCFYNVREPRRGMKSVEEAPKHMFPRLPLTLLLGGKGPLLHWRENYLSFLSFCSQREASMFRHCYVLIMNNAFDFSEHNMFQAISFIRLV